MLRIPNPGSNIDQFIRTFQDLHPFLKDHDEFGLDDITEAMVARNNVTSQGAIGPEAVVRSRREDRSRDALYNQSKMYSELYRALGWIHSATGALNFRFTPLGHHLATAADPKALAKECFLGMVFPNEVLLVRGSQHVRPFAAIVFALAELETLSRDEIIVGPMSIEDDRDPTNVTAMIENLRRMRKKRGALSQAIEAIAANRGLKKATMGNYVRVPAAVPPWAGWATKTAPGILTVTPDGISTAERLHASRDFRLEDFHAAPEAAKEPLIGSGNYRLLSRAGFDVSSVAEELACYQVKTVAHVGTSDVDFSPFQQLSGATIERYAPAFLHVEGISDLTSAEADVAALGPSSAASSSPPLLLQPTVGTAILQDEEADLEQFLRLRLEEAGGAIDQVIEEILELESTSNKDSFYPLVTNLLRVIGFDCRLSRHGVNSVREDALIVDSRHSIPVEIKSPGEEVEISVKGVRQALENKIILLARNGEPYPCDESTSTFVVGYNPPNDRSEVHELIRDIHATFGFNVCVIDLRTLLKVALHRVRDDVTFDLAEWQHFRGVLRVETP